jgi:hypothetical protein
MNAQGAQRGCEGADFIGLTRIVLNPAAATEEIQIGLVLVLVIVLVLVLTGSRERGTRTIES